MMTGASIMETESHDKFFTIFEESPFGNKIINSDLRIIKVNKAMIELLGYGEHEILGKRITDFSHPNFKRRWRVLQRKLWSKKVPVFTMETGILRKDSSILWCQVTSILIADRGETLGYTIVEDISERKALEDLRAEADTSKDEMLNILGHELRTPLAALKSINQLMEMTVDPHADVYRNILKSGLMIKRMERLVQDLLDVPSIQSGKFNLVMTEFNFQDAVQESISSVQQISPSHKIILEQSVNVIIKGDQFRLEQVLVNILNNAVKYSPQADKVIVIVDLDLYNINVSIQDFGIGITRKETQKLFDRYYRGALTTKHAHGLGLGLYIASEIIEKHHGEFWIESEVGKGSTFHFSLPLKPGRKKRAGHRSEYQHN